jgi:hypothetical protein
LPPPEGSKNAVLKLRSVKSIVMAAANTGSLRTSSRAVKPRAQTIKGIRYIGSKSSFIIRALTIVDKKFILPKIELTPATCRLIIAKSTLIPE